MSTLPSITTNFPDWYNEVVYKAELADHAPVRGCMVIRPYGWSIWEQIKGRLDSRIKATGHQNAAFPLLIPESFLKKEAEHVEGFAPELAVVTHAGGKKLEEPLVVRPTSETVIHHMFARWITSWRDLPLKINQWANVVRWELRTRPFLRTTEFYWQEGHTAHATKEEAEKHVLLMLQEYVDLAQNYLAIPVITGRKSESEKFAGAEKTYTFEAFMQDGKALQMGTSHLLSQTFAKAFDMSFQDQEGKVAYPYLTSWGTTTRLIGAVIATHGDQKGIVLPPKIAPIQLVIIPIIKKGHEGAVCSKARELAQELEASGIRVHIDDREQVRPGAKYFEWEMKGVPLRLDLGPRDIENKVATLISRIEQQKEEVTLDRLVAVIAEKLTAIQTQLFASAQERLQKMWHYGDALAHFGPELEQQGGVYQVGWCKDPACEKLLKEYKATIRCVLNDNKQAACFGCKKKSCADVIVGKAY